MTKAVLLTYLRQSVSVAVPTEIGTTTTDPAYLAMTDEQLALCLEMARTRNYSSQITSLDSVPDLYLYPLVLLAKKELYFTLASATAPEYDLGADGAYIKKDVRFNHYMSLISLCDKEYTEYLTNGGDEGMLKSFDTVTVASRNGTMRNFALSSSLSIDVAIDTLTESMVELSLFHTLSNFAKMNVYISENPIVDKYAENKISESAHIVRSIFDPTVETIRIPDLTPSKEYYLAFVVYNRAGKATYKELNFTTPTEEVVVP